MPDRSVERTSMVESQLMPSGINHRALLNSFLRIKRETFFPSAVRAQAYADQHVPYVSSAPHAVQADGTPATNWILSPLLGATLLQAASPSPSDNVLIIGDRIGYLGAVLAYTCTSVIALVEQATIASDLLFAADISNCVAIDEASSSRWKSEAPYDKIIVAGGVEEFPSFYGRYLNPEGGELVCLAVTQPLDGGAMAELTLMTRRGKAEPKRVLSVHHTPILREFTLPPSFDFAS
ncbi:MAG: hypothetical protein K0U36_04490 [Alphaproteobacteria bacterium]|nr:hypothetical protein [Alphaproteobacteria bacterium]